MVILHGNPTSSYMWRKVLGRVARHARCLAPDLASIGASDKLIGAGPGSYRFVEHRRPDVRR
jgi:haloalkane dehalogenase